MTDADKKWMELTSALIKAAETGGVATFKEEDSGLKLRFTVEVVKEAQEKPQWWCWDVSTRSGSPRPHWREARSSHPQTGGYYTVVYGTTADRDAKRDALLEAARKAGKP